jgi:hypothetical protein
MKLFYLVNVGIILTMTMKARKEYYKNLMYKIGFTQSVKQVNEDYYEDFMKLFTNHPNYPEKVKDVIDIKILPNAIHPQYGELNLVKSDGSIDSISYTSCCVLKHDKYKNIKNAMRYAIYPQIVEYKQNAKLICVICQSTDRIEIDHHINKFQQLFLDFIGENPNIPILFDDTYYNSACFRKCDSEYKTKWCAYHKSNAVLRPLCKTCNGKNK